MDDKELWERVQNVPDRKMKPSDKATIWQRVEEEMASASGARRDRRSSPRFDIRGVIGVVATILLVLGLGIGGYQAWQNQTTVHKPKLTQEVPNIMRSNLHAYMVQSKNWRLMAIPKMLKSKGYYDIRLYYIGSKPIAENSVEVRDWSNSVEEFDTNETMHSGDMAYGNITSKPRSSFSGIFLNVNWTTSDGTKKSERLSFAKGSTPIAISDEHYMTGANPDWNVQFAIENIQVPGGPLNYSNLSGTYKGPAQKHVNLGVSFASEKGYGVWQGTDLVPHQVAFQGGQPIYIKFSTVLQHPTIRISIKNKTTTITLHRRR